MSRSIEFYCNLDTFYRVCQEGEDLGLFFWELKGTEVSGCQVNHHAIIQSTADAFLLVEDSHVPPDLTYGPYISFTGQRRLKAGLWCKYQDNRSGKELVRIFERWRNRIRRRSTFDNVHRLFVPNKFRQEYEREKTRIGAEWGNFIQRARNR